MDIDRSANMIKALPFMSNTIVDDTLYEKVLSYLTLVLSTNDLKAIIQLDNKCQILSHIKQACLLVPDQDYRVTTLCIRLLGQLVFYGKSYIFKQLNQLYPELLNMLTDGIRSSEGALRCACIEACHLFIHCKEGYHWLLDNEQATLLITYSLLDQSNYVVSEACRLYSTLLELNAQDLLEIMDPSKLVHSILYPQSDGKQILSALDFCWVVVNTKKENAMIYMTSKKLLSFMIPLLCSSDKMIRAKVLDILSILFTWDNDPLETLDLQDNEDSSTDVDTAYHKLLLVSRTMIIQAVKFDDLITATSLLETILVLLKRSYQGLDSPMEVFDILFSLFNVCFDTLNAEDENYVNLSKLLITDRSKNTLMHIVLRSMDKLTCICPNIVNEQNDFTRLFNMLEYESYYSDIRVLKVSLQLLATTLQSIDNINKQQELLTKAIYSLVKILDDVNNILDSKSLLVVLKSFDSLLSHDQLGTLLTENTISKTLVEALNYKFLDTEWDIRDSVIDFVGQLFVEPVNSTKTRFATTFNLPLEVFGRIQDSEPYVRASALEVLTKMMKTRDGWEYIQQHKSSRELSSKLPSLLYDTEAFVRRAAIDAIVCLVHNRSCQGMTTELEDSKNKNSLNPEILQALIDDQDSDVRVKACQLIENLWILYNHEKSQQKKKSIEKETEINFFHSIQAGKLLVEAANDTNRVVRIEGYRIIHEILQEYRPSKQKDLTVNKKRHFTLQEDEFTKHFLDVISSVDIEKLKNSLDPEHLYQEAFDINADMMTTSLVPTNPDDDMNMLDCY